MNFPFGDILAHSGISVMGVLAEVLLCCLYLTLVASWLSLLSYSLTMVGISYFDLLVVLQFSCGVYILLWWHPGCPCCSVPVVCISTFGVPWLSPLSCSCHHSRYILPSWGTLVVLDKLQCSCGGYILPLWHPGCPC